MTLVTLWIQLILRAIAMFPSFRAVREIIIRPWIVSGLSVTHCRSLYTPLLFWLFEFIFTYSSHMGRCQSSFICATNLHFQDLFHFCRHLPKARLSTDTVKISGTIPETTSMVSLQKQSHCVAISLQWIENSRYSRRRMFKDSRNFYRTLVASDVIAKAWFSRTSKTDLT